MESEGYTLFVSGGNDFGGIYEDPLKPYSE